jgi:hypothetical protein
MRLSVILSGRNDGHCGDFLDRMNRSIETILPLKAEIIFVEWNPPEDRPLIRKVIQHKGIRVITVERDLHNQMHGADLLPFFEYRAKNAGIRRAHGEWILCMNPDILLTPEVRAEISDVLLPGAFYQAARHDIRDGKLVQIAHGPGDFILMHANRWKFLTGYLDVVSYSHIDSLLCWSAVKIGMTKVELKNPIFHQEHDRSAHVGRMSIHSSDIHRLVGQRNGPDWGLANVQLPEMGT